MRYGTFPAAIVDFGDRRGCVRDVRILVEPLRRPLVYAAPTPFQVEHLRPDLLRPPAVTMMRTFEVGTLHIIGEFASVPGLVSGWVERRLDDRRRRPGFTLTLTEFDDDRAVELAAFYHSPSDGGYSFTVVGAVRDERRLFPGLTALSREEFFREPGDGGLPAKPVVPDLGGEDVAPTFVVKGPPRVA